MTINANFTGMSNPNQSILFLSNSCGMLLPGPWRKPPASWNLRFSRFSGEFHSSCLQYSHLIRTCQEPGRKIFGGVLPFLRSFGSGVSRAPGASQLSPEAHSINGGFPGVWELENPTLHAASCTHPVPGPRKMAESLEFGRFASGVSPGRSRPQLIHRLSPPC